MARLGNVVSALPCLLMATMVEHCAQAVELAARLLGKVGSTQQQAPRYVYILSRPGRGYAGRVSCE